MTIKEYQASYPEYEIPKIGKTLLIIQPIYKIQLGYPCIRVYRASKDAVNVELYQV